jgi:hypothetical protein
LDIVLLAIITKPIYEIFGDSIIASDYENKMSDDLVRLEPSAQPIIRVNQGYFLMMREQKEKKKYSLFHFLLITPGCRCKEFFIRHNLSSLGNLKKTVV